MNQPAPKLKEVTAEPKVLNVYECIAKVQGKLAITGIAKDKSGTGAFSYKFRGIDDCYNAIAPLLSEFGLCILPYVVNRSVTERTSKSGGVLFYTLVEMDFIFVSIHDDSKHTIRMYGEAMDSGDKSTNKAMSAAYKYACLQTFCIPVEGESVDSEKDTHTDIQPIVKNQEPQADYSVKDTYKIEPLINNGSIDLDDFAAELEAKIPLMKTLNDVSMLNRANAKTLKVMKEERPDLFTEMGRQFQEKTQSIGG